MSAAVCWPPCARLVPSALSVKYAAWARVCGMLVAIRYDVGKGPA